MNQGAHYDAKVVGAGITGGWAARELFENGLKTLVPDRGRMSRDPGTLILNKNNQLHYVPNMYVTDGAYMASANCINSSLTYMAFAARAADRAAREFRAGWLS